MERSRALLESYRHALDASAIVAITDRRGRIVHANETFCRISKYSKEELLGQDHRLLNSGHHSREFFQKLWRTIASGEIWKGEIKNRAKDDSFYWVDTTIVPLMGEDEKPERYLAIRFETTQRKEAEARLERTLHELGQEREQTLRAEKLSSIGLLAAGVAHEINNPLSGIMACLKTLERGVQSQEKRKTYFSTARDGLDRIAGTVRGLLDYARQSPPKVTHFDVRELIDGCLRLVAYSGKKRDVSYSVESPEAYVLSGDRRQLMQALMNLLLNATYVAPKGSQVVVRVEETEGEVGLSVIDEGPGMPQEVIDRACEPFFTTKPEGTGTGLGLAVTHRIAEAHGGRLAIASAPRQGATVTVWLPRTPS